MKVSFQKMAAIGAAAVCVVAGSAVWGQTTYRLTLRGEFERVRELGHPEFVIGDSFELTFEVDAADVPGEAGETGTLYSPPVSTELRVNGVLQPSANGFFSMRPDRFMQAATVRFFGLGGQNHFNSFDFRLASGPPTVVGNTIDITEIVHFDGVVSGIAFYGPATSGLDQIICDSATLSVEEVIPVVDTDNDGLTDADEDNIYGTDKNLWDTDGDGLSDGEEILGDPTSDPLVRDTDADGIEDPDDPEPRIPDTTIGHMEGLARALAEAILAIDESAFNGPNNNANKGRRTALSNRASAAANAIAAGNTSGAADQLADLLEKTNEWMHVGTPQTDLQDDVSLLIALLIL